MFTATGRYTRRQVWVARGLAMVADALEIGLFPLFWAGELSPANIVVDVFMAVVLTRLLGWHWAFLPSFIAEGLPVVGLFPTWTVAVLYVTRQGADGGGDSGMW